MNSHHSFFQYQYKGTTVTGKLALKIKSGADAKPAWIVTPSDRRRKNEEISESALGNIINAQVAMANRGPKVKRGNDSGRESSPTSLSNTSDGSSDEVTRRRNGRGSPRSDSDDGGSDDVNSGKRKADDAHTNSGNDRSKKTQKTVTFSQESDVTGTSKTRTTKSKNSKVTSTRIVTRSTRGSGEAVLLPELSVKKKVVKGKKVAKDENVTVVKMLTGTLYLYRGDRPRAEFVRYK